MTNNKIQVQLLPSIVRLSLGALLIISPWIWGYTHERMAAASAIFGGTILARLGLTGLLIRPRSWIATMSALIAAWILLGPWFLGFSGEGAAAVIHWIAGVLTLGLTAGEAGVLGSLAQRARLAAACWYREGRSC